MHLFIRVARHSASVAHPEDLESTMPVFEGSWLFPLLYLSLPLTQGKSNFTGLGLKKKFST